MAATSSSPRLPLLRWRVALIITFGWIVHIDNSALVWCRETSLGTSYQQNHPNHVLSTMGVRKGPMETMEPSLATPQTGKPALDGWKLFFFLFETDAVSPQGCLHC